MSSKKSSQAQPGRRGLATLPNQPEPPPIGPTATAPFMVTPPFDREGPVGEPAYRCPAWPPDDPEIAAAVAEAVASGDWGCYQAAALDELVRQIGDFLSVRHVRLTCSGSAAIELALRGAGLGETRRSNQVAKPASKMSNAGAMATSDLSEVICPAFDYPGNARAIRLVGGLPVLVDSLPDRWTIDPDAVEAAASPRTVAVIASHLYGEAAEVGRLRAICDRNHWTLIEDVCQAPGARSDGRPLGGFGHVAAWSFGGSKPLTAGCGGAVTTDDDRIAQRISAYTDRPSNAFPLSPLQAAALLPQWRRIDQAVARQNEILHQLIDSVATATPRWRWPAIDPQGQRRVHYKLPIRLADPFRLAAGARDALIATAESWGIPAGTPFRLPGKLAASRGRVESKAHAEALADRCWLIDHRVLADDPAGLERLRCLLIELHDFFPNQTQA